MPTQTHFPFARLLLLTRAGVLGCCLSLKTTGNWTRKTPGGTLRFHSPRQHRSRLWRKGGATPPRWPRRPSLPDRLSRAGRRALRSRPASLPFSLRLLCHILRLRRRRCWRQPRESAPPYWRRRRRSRPRRRRRRRFECRNRRNRPAHPVSGLPATAGLSPACGTRGRRPPPGAPAAIRSPSGALRGRRLRSLAAAAAAAP